MRKPAGGADEAEPAVETSDDLGGTQCPYLWRHQLQRQRQPVEAPADLGHVRDVVLGQREPGRGGTGPLDEQSDGVDARVWSGIHFRTADEIAIAMGAQVANWALDHHFAPTK